jgi:hypothetical protein
MILLKLRPLFVKIYLTRGLFNTTIEDTEAVAEGKAPGIIFSCSAKIDDHWYPLKEIRYYIIKDHREDV